MFKYFFSDNSLGNYISDSLSLSDNVVPSDQQTL